MGLISSSFINLNYLLLHCRKPSENASLSSPAYVVRGKVIFILGNVCLFTFGGVGGSQVQVQVGGSQVQVGGEVPGPGPDGGVPGPGPGGGGGGIPGLGPGGGGYLVSGLGGYPVLVKGKIFDTRFGLIHVQTRKKNFCRGTPPPVKGKFFDTRFGLIHVQTGEKNCMLRDPPPPQ